jgi:HD-GYP domain-containing protein (c-di-GMP phosphodiesterase class II)
MGYRRISYSLVNHILASDVYTHSGVLLLAKGSVLRDTDITMMMDRGIQEINIEEPISTQLSNQMEEIWDEDDPIIKEYYLSSLENTKSLFLRSMYDDVPPKVEFLETFVPLLEMTLKHSYLYHPLNRIKGHDEYTYRHSLNVGILSSIIGKLIGLSYDECITLGEMGLFHDIGKMKVPQEILQKSGPLTEQEFEEVKLHTLYGYQMLRDMEGTNDLILQGALLHHERLDGSGYPQGVKGEQIPFLVQILSVADTYDAICSDRVYRKKNSRYFAGVELINGVYKGQFNPKIVIPFVHYLSQGLVGFKAILDNGESGEIVLIHSDEPHRPLIRIGDYFVDLRRQRDMQILELVLD